LNLAGTLPLFRGYEVVKALKKILLIEDNKLLADTLNYSAYLLNLNVFSSIGEIDHDEIKMLLPDIVIIDYWLNKWGGNICTKMKSDPLTNHVPVIMLVAGQKMDKAIKENAANAYLPIPFNSDQLNDVINRFI
jgi:DNA-binding response OmpR family regulator